MGTLYVNVSGVWKTVTNLDFNNQGQWEGGETEESGPTGPTMPTLSNPPTLVEQTALDLMQDVPLPFWTGDSRDTVSSNGLDITQGALPFRCTPSTYTSPAPTPGPTIADITTLDWTEGALPFWTADAKGSVDSYKLDIMQDVPLPFMCLDNPAVDTINQTDLAVHYDFGNTASWSGTSTDLTINDITSNNNNASLVTGNTYTKNTANGGSIQMTTGTESLFTLGTTLTYSNTQDFTFFCGYQNDSAESGWEMWAGNADQDNFIGRSGNSYYRIQDGSNNNIDISGTTGGGSGLSLSGTDIRVLYVVKDNQTGYFYEDGQLANGGTTNTSFGDISFRGNQYYTTNAYRVAHKLFFWGFYNRALSASEIATNYQIHKTRLGI